jgi:hypothetical protein
MNDQARMTKTAAQEAHANSTVHRASSFLIDFASPQQTIEHDADVVLPTRRDASSQSE